MYMDSFCAVLRMILQFTPGFVGDVLFTIQPCICVLCVLCAVTYFLLQGEFFL